jgi:hypothetical protein
MPSMQAPESPAPANPADAAGAAVLLRQAAHHVPGSVGGIIVNEDDFPGDTGQRCLEPVKQLGDVVALVEGRDDNRNLRQTGGLQRAFGV